MLIRLKTKRPFEIVYQDHFSYIYNIIYMRVLRHELAEDLTSDTFLKAIHAYDRYDATKASERTWLASIARNRLIDYYRSSERQRVDHIEDETLSALPSTDAETGEILEANDTVRRILSHLSEEERDLLVMRYYEDKTNPEIADILEINAKAVSERFRRLHAKCQRIADELGLEI